IIRGIGIVPTNRFSVGLNYSTVPWLGYSAPWSRSMMGSGLTNVLAPALPNSGPVDVLLRQERPGGAGVTIEYCIDAIGYYDGGTNFYPSTPGYDKVEADMGFKIKFAPQRSGTASWQVE
ncbi:MAG: hypothetical protein N2595_05760, partial [bacterium]|nr:hypothetical protein [bacterium]